jgi:hypothetical protein
MEQNQKAYFSLTTPERKFELRCDDERIARKWVDACSDIVRLKTGNFMDILVCVLVWV